MKRLVQLIPSHHARDAAGSEVLAIERIVSDVGWLTETYADNVDAELQGRTKLYGEFDSENLEDTIVLYHYCAASEMTFRFAELECPKGIVYHNITPDHFFEPYNPDIAIDCREGRRQLSVLAENVDLAIAKSEFSRLELEEVGFDVTRTVPFLFDSARLDVEPDAVMMQRLEGNPVILFVGRMVPNKAPDDFIRVAHSYFRSEGQPAKFVLAGKKSVLPLYVKEIDALLAESGLTEEQFLVTDEISDAELAACYRSASVFLSLSRHEGFCVPMLEAMHFGVPILALAAAAVPETVGDAGILFETTDPKRIAEIVNTMLGSEDLRKGLIERGRQRLKRYDLERWGFALHVMLDQLWD